MGQGPLKNTNHQKTNCTKRRKVFATDSSRGTIVNGFRIATFHESITKTSHLHRLQTQRSLRKKKKNGKRKKELTQCQSTVCHTGKLYARRRQGSIAAATNHGNQTAVTRRQPNNQPHDDNLRYADLQTPLETVR